MLLKADRDRLGHTQAAGSFSGLMALYEFNYLRLRNIAPDLGVADEMVSTVPNHHDLYLTVNQRCKYTTMLSLTYRFGGPANYLLEPNLHLKIYHDAKVVEVHQLHSRLKGFLDINDEIQHKWTMNRFLYRWLGYCLYQGHYFQPMQHYKNVQRISR